jgi:glycosyltransferase involved in cell wall biosynthesis
VEFLLFVSLLAISSTIMPDMRIAYVHDWLVTYRGGEKVLAALLDLYPEAPVFTLFYDPRAMPPAITRRDVRQPLVTRPLRRLRKALLPALPALIEGLPLAEYDLIISTSSCVAKGAVKHAGARHVCYLHSPMRYIWDQQAEYLQSVAHLPGASWAIQRLTPRLRRWDIASASATRVDRFVANSSFVRDRARRYYGRDAAVLHPPVELERFSVASPTGRRGGYLLAAGALVSYKRFDLAIAACALARRPLVIAGSGPMEAALRRQAAATPGAEVRFEIGPSDPRLVQLLQEAEALLFPGVEDFGMLAIEAMACGTPVIAFQAGGARDFIEPGVTGLFFGDAAAESLADCLQAYVPRAFDAAVLNRYAARYDRSSFLARFREEIAKALNGETS